MEKHAQAVLTLLLPHRHVSDLKPKEDNPLSFPFTRKLQEVYRKDEARKERRLRPRVFTDENVQFLQNIQDCGYNSMRYKLKEDDLQSATVPFTTDDMDLMTNNEDGDESDTEYDTATYEWFSLYFEDDEEVDVTDSDSDFLTLGLQKFSFKNARNRGEGGVGYNKYITPIEVEVNEDEEDFVVYLNNNASGSTRRFVRPLKERRIYHMVDVIEVLLRRSEARTRGDLFPHNPNTPVQEAVGTVKSIVSWCDAANLDIFQRRAFETIIAAFLLTFYEVDDEEQPQLDSNTMRQFRKSKQNLKRLRGGRNSQLIMLLHGPGGSGKSTVLDLVVAYAKEFCAYLNHPFTNRTICVTAMSGAAATLLRGETTHSVLDLNKNKVSDDTRDEFQDCRLLAIDEISFAGAPDHEKIYCNLQYIFDERFKPFGGLSVLFLGDYSQVEPIRSDPIYSGALSPYYQMQLNAYIELDGRWRFQDDPEWGERMSRFREGEPTLSDVRTINDSCLVQETRKPPPNTQVATFKNKNRDAVNALVFEQYCSVNSAGRQGTYNGAIAIFMDNLQMKDSKTRFALVTSNRAKQHFWVNCSEDSLVPAGQNDHRVDPVLKLYQDCPLMIPKNIDVQNGQANGSRVFFKKIKVKYGETPFLMSLASQNVDEEGPTIRGFFASQIESLLVEHENRSIVPNVCEIKPSDVTFEAKLEIDGEKLQPRMKGTQIPLISNSATTGHKLQGYTARTLLVQSWHYQSNWAYVVLSRVKTMAGLYILEPLSEDLSKYAMPQKMKDMLKTFRDTILLEPLTESDYSNIERSELSL
jgi:hypothetical protein